MSFNDYFRRDGSPYPESKEGFEEYTKDRKKNRRVADTTLADGKWVSTVWLGLNHSYGDGPPLIFETMVFPSRDDFTDLDCKRYATEEEATTGHKEMIEKWSKNE